MPQILLPDGDALYYETHGEGPPLLLVAGLGGVGSFWEPHVAALAEHFTLVIHDHRGCGRSAHSPIAYSIRQMAGDVLALMDALQIERAHYLGHSTGGAIGQVLAIEHPSRIDALLLSSTFALADPYLQWVFELRLEALSKVGLPFYSKLGSLLLYPPARLARNLEALDAAQPTSALPAASSEIIKRRIAAVMRHDCTKDLPRVTHRTLVCCARDDMLTPPYMSGALARLIPNARVAMFPSGGHFYNHAWKAEFADLVVRFLADDKVIVPSLSAVAKDERLPEHFSSHP